MPTQCLSVIRAHMYLQHAQLSSRSTDVQAAAAKQVQAAHTLAQELLERAQSDESTQVCVCVCLQSRCLISVFLCSDKQRVVRYCRIDADLRTSTDQHILLLTHTDQPHHPTCTHSWQP